jgi:hypothetical protein
MSKPIHFKLFSIVVKFASLISPDVNSTISTTVNLFIRKLIVHCTERYVYLLPAVPLSILPVRRPAHGAVTVSSYGCILYRSRPGCNVFAGALARLRLVKSQLKRSPPTCFDVFQRLGQSNNVLGQMRIKTSVYCMLDALFAADFDRFS